MCVCVESLLKTQKGPLWHTVSGAGWPTLPAAAHRVCDLWRAPLLPPRAALMIWVSSWQVCGYFSLEDSTHDCTALINDVFVALLLSFENEIKC